MYAKMKNNYNTAVRILELLKEEYPGKTTALEYSNNFELLVATILSAQCTDNRVNIVTKKLFSDYKHPSDFANMPQSTLEQYIRSTGFYKNKAKNIIKTSQMLVSDFKGQVPSNMQDLIKLPGVARKTANIVLNYGFGKPEGIAVDTHVKRLSYRLGLTSSKNPDQIEQDLVEALPKKLWIEANNLLVWHGRTICKSRKPLCGECKLNQSCPSAFRTGAKNDS